MPAATFRDGAGQRLSLDRIAEASRAIHPAFRDSPALECEPLGARLGGRVTLKLETLNPVRSFKGRGTDWLLQCLAAEEGADVPLACASAGNFGQGLAWAGRARGRRVTVFASEHANPLKLDRMRALGATVRLAGRDFDAAKEVARAWAHETGARFIEDGREAPIAEGAGTIAVELLRQAPVPDAIVIPLGNGALAAGMARWIRAHHPGVRVVAACAAGAPAMARSIESGTVVALPGADTIADGIAVRVPVPEALDDLRGGLDEVLLVDDATIVSAMRLLWREHGLVVEPAGAVGVAALLAHEARFRGHAVATPLCGANVTDDDARRWQLG